MKIPNQEKNYANYTELSIKLGSYVVKSTWEVISKWKRSWARAETPTVEVETPWGPSDSDSEALGLQQLAYRNLRAFPISDYEFQNFGNPVDEEAKASLFEKEDEGGILRSSR